MFDSDDIKGGYERMEAGGGEFAMPPIELTASTIAQAKDGCGNVVQIVQSARW